MCCWLSAILLALLPTGGLEGRGGLCLRRVLGGLRELRPVKLPLDERTDPRQPGQPEGHVDLLANLGSIPGLFERPRTVASALLEIIVD